ncbi:MAG: dephospho-CoA kinase [Fibrobacterota bacterium]|nr:dephospho-CoA kinase [Chitinispirillaceae bacterium]
MSPLKIGIAGYMGSGKSSSIKFLEMSSLLSLNADQIAKSLMHQSSAIRQELKKAYGDQVCPDQSIDFTLLGSIVFNSPPALKQLNAIVHPPLLQHLHHLMTKSFDPVIRYVLLDAALIPLWNIEPWFDMLIWVDAPAEVRLKRLIERSHGTLSKNDLQKRMAEQEALFKKSSGYAWFDILNDGTEDDLKSKCTHVKELLEAKSVASS